jgi:toxin ParE1/3/4
MPEVRITEPAERSLNHIFYYYFKEVSLELANRISELILNRIETLSLFYERGRVVDELRDLNQNHRYIIEGSFKIIYREMDDIIYVTDIFPMHMNPEKIKKRN